LPDIGAIIGVIGGAVGIVGGGGGLLGLWRGWRQEHRDEAGAFFASYEKSMATLEKQYERETDAARKEEKKQRLEALEKEYVEQQEAYRQNSALRQSAPRGVLNAERPSPPKGVAAELTELLEKADRLSPALVTAHDHLLRGNTLFELKRYEEALDEYNAALALRPDDPVTLYSRGTTLSGLGWHQEALADYNRALELRPDDPDALNNRGNALGELERHEEALADYNRSLELRPDHPATLHNRGNTLRHLNRYDEALADYNRSLKLRPDHPDTMYDVACLYSLWKRYEEALQWLEKAVGSDAENRPMAREDEDFEGLRNDPEWGPKFLELVGTEDQP
jgi:tetratricopeptide (TPR) repeat protein